jgi:hypothetical protein
MSEVNSNRVGDHQLQEQPIKRRSLCSREVGHLFRSGHTGHRMPGVHRLVRRGIGNRFASVAQPLLHELDFVSLRNVDAAGHVDEFRTIGPVAHQGGHLQRLVMVRDHVLHESQVGRRVARDGNLDRLGSAELP